MISAIEADRRIHKLPPLQSALIDGFLVVALMHLEALRQTILTHAQQHELAQLESEIQAAREVAEGR